MIFVIQCTAMHFKSIFKIKTKDYMQLLLDAQIEENSKISTDGMHLSELENLKIDKKLTPEVDKY